MYEQSERLNAVQLRSCEQEAGPLASRFFNCISFEKRHGLKPVGLAFSQVLWDQSVDATFTTALNMKPPTFA